MAGNRLEEGMGRQGLHAHGATHLLRGGDGRQRSLALRHAQHRRARVAGLRITGAEAVLPAQDPRR